VSKKAFKPPRIAPLQRVVAEPITDPAEQAALDKARKQIKRKQRKQEATIKAFKPPRIAPLQRVVAEPITDPAEQERLAKLYKQFKRKQRQQEAAMNRKGGKRASKSAKKKRT
jgi:hypothetical protein